MQNTPKPNTLAVSWFYGEYQKKTLVITPKYQRNPIWSLGQKCFLIDSLLSGCPIPQIFLNIKTEGSGASKRTFYEVVDGQQRLRAVLEYIEGCYTLVETAAKSYPVSEFYKPHIGKKYSELPDKLQNVIWDYPLAVQELRGWDDPSIRALFRRLNYVVERLNAQELRHSNYFGDFIRTVEGLAKEQVWDDFGIFTRRDSERMKDVEFVSELLALVIAGIQDQQKGLDQFYADYDVIFPQKSKHLSRFRQTVESLVYIQDTIRNTRFHAKSDFYGLFAAVLRVNKPGTKAADLSPAAHALKALSEGLERAPGQLSEPASSYYPNIIEGPNKLPKREKRTEILRELLVTHIS